jgi:hypothetical protein
MFLLLPVKIAGSEISEEIKKNTTSRMEGRILSNNF